MANMKRSDAIIAIHWKAGEITAKKAMELTDTMRTSFYKLVSLMDEE